MKLSLVNLGRTEGDEIEVLDWTRLFNNRKWQESDGIFQDVIMGWKKDNQWSMVEAMMGEN